jgi:hypothetical protein
MSALDTSKIVIFDSGNRDLDRYTILPYFLDRKKDSLTRSMYLAMSKGGSAISMWGDIGRTIGDKYYKPYMFELYKLGKRIKFNDLDIDSQKHILSRIAD